MIFGSQPNGLLLAAVHYPESAREVQHEIEFTTRDLE
jgi:hypothetical protein